MSRDYNIGIVQFTAEICNKEENILHALDLFDQAGDSIDIICYPELFTTGYQLDIVGEQFYSLAETVPGATTDRFAELAKKYATGVIGNIVEKDPQSERTLYDTTFFIDEYGAYQGKYRKIHLYPGEEQFFTSGEEFPVFTIHGIRVGSAICFDHAFGEMFRILALKGAEVIFIPSAIPKGYEYLINLRTRARAQDNQMFTVAVNRAGREGSVEYCGNSMIANPRGEVLCKGGDREEILVGQVDLSLIKKERKQEPILRELKDGVFYLNREKLQTGKEIPR